MGFGSAHAPLRVWLQAGDDGLLVVLSMRNLLDARDTEAIGSAVTIALPACAVVARTLWEIPALSG